MPRRIKHNGSGEEPQTSKLGEIGSNLFLNNDEPNQIDNSVKTDKEPDKKNNEQKNTLSALQRYKAWKRRR